MSQVNPYASIAKRTFASALVHLLETEYGLLGGRRILQLLAEDVQRLVEEFYPASERAASGTLIWTCTADEGQKAVPGKRTEEYKTVTVRLPLITVAELQARTDATRLAADRPAPGQAQVARLAQAAAEQGGLLTIADLSVMVNRSYEVTRRYARDWEDAQGELLPLKGLKMDQGCRPTHKVEIVRLSEQGLEPPDIAREAAHDLKSVERYLKDYERVRLLLKRGLDAEAISDAIGRGQRVVLEYVKLAREYHPELFPAENQ